MRRILWITATLLVTGSVLYLGAVSVTKRTVEQAGRSLRDYATETTMETIDLPPGSVLLLQGDTVATLTAVSRITSAVRSKEPTFIFAGQLHQDSVGSMQRFAAVEDSVPRDSRARLLRLKPLSEVSGRRVRGRLILRTPGDTAHLLSLALH